MIGPMFWARHDETMVSHPRFPETWYGPMAGNRVIAEEGPHFAVVDKLIRAELTSRCESCVTTVVVYFTA